MKRKKVIQEVRKEYQICGRNLCKIHKVKKVSKTCYNEKCEK